MTAAESGKATGTVNRSLHAMFEDRVLESFAVGRLLRPQAAVGSIGGVDKCAVL